MLIDRVHQPTLSTFGRVLSVCEPAIALKHFDQDFSCLVQKSMRFGTHHVVITLCYVTCELRHHRPNKAECSTYYRTTYFHVMYPKHRGVAGVRAVPTLHPTTDNEHILIFSFKNKYQQLLLLKAFAYLVSPPAPRCPLSAVGKWRSRVVVVPLCLRSAQTVVIYRSFLVCFFFFFNGWIGRTFWCSLLSSPSMHFSLMLFVYYLWTLPEWTWRI